MSMKGFVVLVVAVLVFYAAPRAYAGPPPDACSLLTSAQVSAALGIQVSGGQHILAGSGKLCGWNRQGSHAPSPKRVVLSLENASTWAAKKMPVQGITKMEAPGVGDDAIYITTPGFGTGFNVKKGNTAFTIRVYGFPLDQTKAKEKALAVNVLSKM